MSTFIHLVMCFNLWPIRSLFFLSFFFLMKSYRIASRAENMLPISFLQCKAVDSHLGNLQKNYLKILGFSFWILFHTPAFSRRLWSHFYFADTLYFSQALRVLPISIYSVTTAALRFHIITTNHSAQEWKEIKPLPKYMWGWFLSHSKHKCLGMLPL